MWGMSGWLFSYFSILEFLLRNWSSLLPFGLSCLTVFSFRISFSTGFLLLLDLQTFCLPRKHVYHKSKVLGKHVNTCT